MRSLAIRRRRLNALPITAVLVLLPLACGADPGAPARTELPARPRGASGPPDSPAARAAPVPSASAAPPPEIDACHVDAELLRAHAVVDANSPASPWVAAARAHLYSREDAERALGGISQEVVSLLGHRRYEKLAHFVGEAGLCLRAARGAPCEAFSRQELQLCGHSAKKRPFKADGAGGAPSGPGYSCGEALKKLFYSRDFLRTAKVTFNCFPEAAAAVPASPPLVVSGPSRGYVEFRDGTAGAAPESLWLVFDGSPEAPVLVEMVSDHPG